MNSLRKTLLAAAALAVAACSQPALIDRTQPNYTKKADLLDGTWYIQDTVVDAPKTPSITVVGESGRMEKIRWEVQEDLLVGYRSYEIVPGGDPRVDHDKSTIGHVVFQDGKPFKGNPVVAYRIQSHFDRQRQYNASTGEQSNVLVEDAADRPWYEREFMRVDWTHNVIQNNESCTGPGGARCASGQSQFLHYVTASDQVQNDEAQVFERDGSGVLKYMDWTTQAIVDPPSVNYPGYGRLPYCLFNPMYDCESVNVKIRTSVLKVDGERESDYEPLIYGEKLMKKFGFFRNELITYNKDYYYTESGRQLLAMRHNIWGHAKRPVLDSAGKQVIDTKTGRPQLEPIPVTERSLRPIVYYMTANTPKEIWGSAAMRHASAAGLDPTQTIEASWSHAFQRAVAVPRGIEASEVPQMFYVCESPVQKGAPAACGKEGTFARMGDLRFNTIPYVEQNAGGLLGLGPSSIDPETGMVIHAAANIYGTVMDTWAGSSQQVIDVVNGEVSLDKLIAGQDIKDYVFANLNPSDPRRPLNGPWKSQQALSADSTRPMSSYAKTTGKLQTLMQAWHAEGSLPLAKENRKAVVEQILKNNPQLENELINLPEVKVGVQALSNAAGFQAKLGDSEFYRLVARNMLLGVDPVSDAMDAIRKTPSPEVGCYYDYSYTDEDYVGVAKRKAKLQADLIAKYTAQGDATCAAKTSCTATEATALAKNEVFNSLRREAYRSVAEHEIGHTLGLMHNFIGSADALNYKDGYWDLRKQTIGVEVGGRRVLPVTPQNMLDASKPSQDQVDKSMYEHTYSSIMDYGARVNAQNMGIGKYDEAAILFAYAGGFEPGWVEVFNEMRADYQNPNITIPVDNQAKVFTVRGAHVEIPLAQVEHYTPVSNFYSDKYHYSTLPFHFADQKPSFEEMLDQGIKRMNNRSFRKWSEMQKYYTAIEASLKNYSLSEGGLQSTDYVRARDIINAAGGKTVPVEVPYMYCSDYEVGANLLCNLHDQGADVFEETSKWIERFNQSYVFSNFRRDRVGYSPASVVSGKFGRYLGNIPNVYQQWLFNIYYLSNYLQLSPEELDKYYGLGDPIWQNYWTMAVTDSTNLLMQQLAIPQVGYHGKRADGTWVSLSQQAGDPQNRRLSTAAEQDFVTRMRQPSSGGYTDVLYIPRGPGRSQFSVYDTFGYDNFTRVNEAGHFWDVYASMLALTTSETNFLGVDRGSDALRYSLPYYITFNHELAPLFSSYWAQQPEYYAPLIGKNADGTGTVSLPTFLKAQDYVSGFQYPPPTPTPVDGNGNAMVMSKVIVTPTWSARFFAQVWGMAYFTGNFNLEYAEFSKVYRLGSSEALTPSPGFDVLNFDDPFGGGYSYAALRKQGDPNPPSGPAMVQRGIDQSEKWRQVCRLDHNLPQGAPVALPCGAGTNTVDGLTATQWEAATRETVRSLEMMRGLYNVFGRAL